MKKKLLVVGGSYGDIPFIKEAKKLGFHVITSGNNKKDLGHKFSDEHHLRDFSDQEAILKLARSLNIDYIVPSCHDLSMISCSYVAETLGLPGYDSYETVLDLHHKDRFRRIAKDMNLMSPKAFSFDSVVKAKKSCNIVPIPCIIKPIDLGGGKGITIVKDKDNLNKAIDYAFEYSKANAVVIEEFVKGSLHSFSSFIYDKKVVFFFGDNEFSSVNPYGVSISSSPSFNIDLVKNKLISEIEKIAKEYNLSNGLLHMQYLLDNDNISIIEFTRRMPGDWYSIPVELSTGINHAYWTLQGFLDGDFSKLEQNKQKGFYSRHCVMAFENGRIEDLYIDESIKGNIVNSYIWIDEYSKVDDFLYQKFGLVFLEYKTISDMIEKIKNIDNLIKVKIKKDEIQYN